MPVSRILKPNSSGTIRWRVFADDGTTQITTGTATATLTDEDGFAVFTARAMAYDADLKLYYGSSPDAGSGAWSCAITAAEAQEGTYTLTCHIVSGGRELTEVERVLCTDRF